MRNFPRLFSQKVYDMLDMSFSVVGLMVGLLSENNLYDEKKVPHMLRSDHRELVIIIIIKIINHQARCILNKLCFSDYLL